MSTTDSRFADTVLSAKIAGTNGMNALNDTLARRAPSRAKLTDVAIMMGALSIVMFWAFGIGIAVGALAVVTALWADRGRDIEGSRPSRDDLILAVSTGALGIAAGAGFLLVLA